MTRDDVFRMAKAAGIESWWNEANARQDTYEAALERFADLVAGAEREACAQIVEVLQKNRDRAHLSIHEPFRREISAAIRGRGSNKPAVLAIAPRRRWLVTAPGRSQRWMWSLPGAPSAPKVLKKNEDAQQNNVSTFGKNEHLRHETGATKQPPDDGRPSWLPDDAGVL